MIFFHFIHFFQLNVVYVCKYLSVLSFISHKLLHLSATLSKQKETQTQTTNKHLYLQI